MPSPFTTASDRALRELRRQRQAACVSSGATPSPNTAGSVSESLVTDDNGVVHIRRTSVSPAGAVSVAYLNPNTSAVTTPAFPLASAGSDSGPDTNYNTLTRIETGTFTIPACESYALSLITDPAAAADWNFNGLAITGTDVPVLIAFADDSEGRGTINPITVQGGTNRFVLHYKVAV